MHVLSLIYPVMINQQVCQSQILILFTFLKILGKTRILGFSKITVESSWKFEGLLLHAH